MWGVLAMKPSQRVIAAVAVFLAVCAVFITSTYLTPCTWAVKTSPASPRDGFRALYRGRSESNHVLGPSGGHPETNAGYVAHHTSSPDVRRRKLFRNHSALNADLTADELASSVSVSELPAGDTQSDPWEIWQKWVNLDRLYPEDAFWSDEMNQLLKSMATARITSFGGGDLHNGKQLKLITFLGKQKALFKPMWYPRDKVMGGGHDKHNGEIAGFHLDGVLGFNMAPPVVGRRINLTALRPITAKDLLSTYVVKNGNTCFYGNCRACEPARTVCADGEIMEGSVALWLPKWYKLKALWHPWMRAYQQEPQPRWVKDDSYCQRYLEPSGFSYGLFERPLVKLCQYMKSKNDCFRTFRADSDYHRGLLEITDGAVFDFLMGNNDRHHYETYAESSKPGRMIHLDNGQTFDNPYHDTLSILAPLKQCCRLRNSTWSKLNFFHENEPLSEALDRSMRRDPVYPILTQEHLTAINRRLSIIIDTVHQCIRNLGKDTVIVSSWGD